MRKLFLVFLVFLFYYISLVLLFIFNAVLRHEPTRPGPGAPYSRLFLEKPINNR